MNVKYTLGCVEPNKSHTFSGEEYWYFKRDATGAGFPFNLNLMKDMNQVTFTVDLEIQSSIEYEELNATTIYCPSQIAYLLCA